MKNALLVIPKKASLPLAFTVLPFILWFVGAISMCALQPIPTAAEPAHHSPFQPPPGFGFDEIEDPAPRVAIIIDDLGLYRNIAYSFMDLEIPLSLSILPKLAYSKEIAETAHFRKYDVLFHIPMEPYKFAKAWAGKHFLLSSMSSQKLEKTLKAGMESVPYIIGANNHMGSKLTEDEEAMSVVLKCLKNLNLFFVDSVTTPDTIAYSMAKKMRLRTARRNVFLDNKREKSFIVRQFYKLKKSALAHGSAIGIGHPHRATLSVLKEMIPKFQASGIRFVPVSELVR